MARTKKRKRRPGALRTLILVSFPALLLCGMLTHSKIELNKSRLQLANKEAALEEQVKDLEQEQDHIKEYKDYTKSKKFIEETAREKLNLIYPGEVIFESEH